MTRSFSWGGVGEILRWIGFIPAAVTTAGIVLNGASSIAFLLVMLYDQLFPISSRDVESAASDLSRFVLFISIPLILVHPVATYLFVRVGTAVAPSHKVRVAYILTGIWVAYLIATTVAAFTYDMPVSDFALWVGLALLTIPQPFVLSYAIKQVRAGQVHPWAPPAQTSGP